MNWGTCTSCKYRFCTQCKAKLHPYQKCKETKQVQEHKLQLTKEQHEEAKKAEAEVKHAYDKIINERKNLFFMSKCTKNCPNAKCNFTI
jgi:translation elongation factor EF-1alpha